MMKLYTVDAEEIKRLGKRFKKLDLDNSGSLSVDEFMSLPELQQNPLVQRVIELFDTDGNGEVDFKGKQYFQWCLCLLHLNINVAHVFVCQCAVFNNCLSLCIFSIRSHLAMLFASLVSTAVNV